MILNIAYTSKSLYISNQIRSRFRYLLLGLNTIDLYIRSFYYFINAPTFMDNKINFYIKEKF